MTSFLFKSFAPTEKKTNHLYTEKKFGFWLKETNSKIKKNNDDQANHKILECIQKGESSIINVIANCLLGTVLKMPVESVGKCVKTDINIQRSLFLHISLSVLAGCCYCTAMLFKCQKISTNAEFFLEIQNTTCTCTIPGIRLKCWKMLFFSLLVCTFKNVKSLKWISSILFDNNKNKMPLQV